VVYSNNMLDEGAKAYCDGVKKDYEEERTRYRQRLAVLLEELRPTKRKSGIEADLKTASILENW
jgi:hypothetical protein